MRQAVPWLTSQSTAESASKGELRDSRYCSKLTVCVAETQLLDIANNCEDVVLSDEERLRLALKISLSVARVLWITMAIKQTMGQQPGREEGKGRVEISIEEEEEEEEEDNEAEEDAEVNDKQDEREDRTENCAAGSPVEAEKEVREGTKALVALDAGRKERKPIVNGWLFSIAAKAASDCR